MVTADLIALLNNATGCIFWYRLISEDYIALYIGDDQHQIQNFSKKKQIFMELCAEVTVLLQVIALRGDHLLLEAERNDPFEQLYPDCCRFSVILCSTGKSSCLHCSGGVLCNVSYELTIINIMNGTE